MERWWSRRTRYDIGIDSKVATAKPSSLENNLIFDFNSGNQVSALYLYSTTSINDTNDDGDLDDASEVNVNTTILTTGTPSGNFTITSTQSADNVLQTNLQKIFHL